MQPDFSRQLERATELASQVRAEWLLRHEVMAVGAGMERRRGRPTGKAAIIAVVRKKLTARQLSTQQIEPLPQDIQGIPVDVIKYQSPPEDEATRKAFEQTIRRKNRVSARLRAQPNVTGVGVGYKVIRGELTDQPAIQVLVEEKLPRRELRRRGLTPIPSKINGVPTDVIQAGPFTSTESPSGSRGDRQDPLRGGLSVGYAGAPFHYGTLGAVVFDSTNRPMVLSNEHVLDGDIGDTVHQPSPVGLDDSFEIGFQLDVCNPLNFIRIDTPDTLGGSILAGAAIAAAIAAALSDEIDPSREGQQATPPPPGALTLEEYTKVKIDYPSWPLPGTPFQMGVDWTYERRLDSGVLGHHESSKRKNQHQVRYHRLFTDRRHYRPEDTIRLFGIVLPPETLATTSTLTTAVIEPPRIPCKYYHCVALLHPTSRDRSYPVVLRALEDAADDRKLRALIFDWLNEQELNDEESRLLDEHRQELCIYYGEHLAEGLPLESWNHWMFVQTTNVVPPGTDPLVSARIIGGLPVSDHYRSTLDIACGPFVFEDDGSFDIELLSI